MGRSSRRWGAGWARISRQSLHKSLLIARSQNGPIRSLDISKFRTRPHPYPSLSNRSADRLESSSNFVPSDGLIFMQTFALTLFKHPPRPEPSAHAKFVYAQARKRRFSRLTVYKIRTLHPPQKKTSPLLQLHRPQDADFLGVQAFLDAVENVHVDGTFVAQAFEHTSLVGDHGKSQRLYLSQEGLQL